MTYLIIATTIELIMLTAWTILLIYGTYKGTKNGNNKKMDPKSKNKEL